LIKAIKDPNVKTLSEAGQIAGYNHRQNTHRGLQTVTVQNALADYLIKLEDGGVNDELIIKKMKEGLNSKRKTYFQLNGKVKSEKIDPDYAVRFKYLQEYHRLKQFISGGAKDAGPQDNRHQLVIIIGEKGIDGII
jgi:macrodomain Ter protein organizer (MatP/YcbG family)